MIPMEKVDRVRLRFLAVLFLVARDGESMSVVHWSQRPAIVWKDRADDVSNGYWNEELLSKLSCKKDDTCSISYQQLFTTTAHLVSIFRLKLKNLPNITNGRPVGIPIAVAIPEGPLLPLAVLMVHALNHPVFSKDGSSFFAVLVPLEPSEGKDRLLHMVNDVRPSFILGLPGKDMDRLEDILTDVTLGTSGITSEGLYLPESVEVIDFSQVVKQAIGKQPKTSPTDERILHILDYNKFDMQLLELIAQCMEHVYIEGETSYVDSQISHVVYTSGTTGRPKGCISSIRSLQRYLQAKNEAHQIDHQSTVLLASALSFDPCLSDVLATFQAKAALAVAPRKELVGNLTEILSGLFVTHVLCTPTLWSMVHSTGSTPRDFPSLQVVALGGEPIPKQIRQTWAHAETDESTSGCRLFATYGVTEACVYQTAGEVLQQSNNSRHDVGHPLRGSKIRICQESEQTFLVDVSERGHASGIGEVVIHGAQVDSHTSYLNRSELRHKFVCEEGPGQEARHFYRTGDRGYIDEVGKLRILGRIQGEAGMVKINGVRVELGEIEAALCDDDQDSDSPPVVLNCLVKAKPSDEGNSSVHDDIQAYCVVSGQCLRELGVAGGASTFPGPGILITGGPFLTLLRARCATKVKSACIPSAFMVIASLPLSPTGKRDREGLPILSDCVPLDTLSADGKQKEIPLRDYGSAGAVVAENIINYLNLQPCQEVMLTSAVSFSMLGGDSLAATRVMRTLYAYHHNVDDTRFLGGEFGRLGDSFDVVRLMRAQTLGDFIDTLDRNNLCRARGTRGERTVKEDQPEEPTQTISSGTVSDTSITSEEDEKQSQLYEALIQAVTSGQSGTAVAILNVGANPNHGVHNGRLGKLSDRIAQKKLFRSSPMHLACLKGDRTLVQKLLQKKSRFNSPDASGVYPLQLAASGVEGEDTNGEGDKRRLECIRFLLDAGAPITMRDGNKQTVLHSAARAGHYQTIQYVMARWKEINGEQDPNPARHFFNWTDRWQSKCICKLIIPIYGIAYLMMYSYHT
jgi:acyl-CoA synthetase (AMP-forming)/AMP-acid ligase II